MKYLLILFSICFLLTFIWFRGGNILGGGDEGLAFYSPNISLNLSKTTWVEYSTGGTTVSWLPRVNLLYFYSVLERIGIPPFILQASLFFTVMFIGVISIYHLCLLFLKNDDKSKLVSLVAAIFYLLNPFTMSQVWARGQSAQYIAFALLPFALLLFAQGIKRRSFLFSILTVFALSIFAAAFGFLTFIIVYWLTQAIFLLFIVLTEENKLNTVIFGLIFFFLTFFLWAVVNSWWLMPLFLSAGSIYSTGISGSEENLGTLRGVSRNFTPDILIRLLQRTYFFDPSAFSPVYSSFIFQLISFTPLIFVLIGLIKMIKSKELVKFRFFAVLLILGLIVSLGANPPLGWLFVEIFKQSSVLQAFRNPFEKFGLIYSLGYSAIFGYGLISFFDKKKFKILGIISVLILTCGIFAWPMWTGRVIAGPDKKIGISVPTYYKDLQGWLNYKGEDYRLFMTPIWSGDGAFYQWSGGGRFQGADPMIYILETPAVSNSTRGPYYYEFITGIRKYMERVNVTPSLQFLRAKYLVDRKDAIMITQTEKDHKKFLTKSIFPPLGENISTQKVCDNLYANSRVNNTAWITCQIPPEQSNWADIRYLHLKIKTDVPSFLDIALGDKNGTRIRWDGRADAEYSSGFDWTPVTIALGAPTEYNFAIDFSKVDILEVQARPKDNVRISVKEISLRGVSLDPGKEEKIAAFHLVNNFGNLEVYEPNEFKAPPEFGSLSKVSLMDNFLQFFERANKEKDSINKIGFILTSQNKDKNLQDLQTQTSLQISEKQKISNTRYWLKTDRGGRGLIILSKTFNPQWKLLPAVSQKELSGNIFDDLNLLKRLSLDEENHYVVNGYANLWKVDEDTEYAIVYLPQVIADIGFKISKLFAYLVLGVAFILILKKYVKKIF